MHIYAKQVRIGRNVTLKSDIGTPDNPVERLVLGDCVHIGPGCNIQVPELTILDYTKIHRNCLVYGRNPLSIGYNCWFGEGTIIDAEGYTTIGNNVGVGAHSQLWSHIRHGDLLQGCQLYKFGRLTICNDAWLVGHCITSPVSIAEFSVALVGSVITQDMAANRIYGGCPAKDLTERLGAPYLSKPPSAKRALLARRLDEFHAREGLLPIAKAVDKWPETLEPNTSYFNVTTRTYTKRRTDLEQALMKFLLPEAKFTPESAV